jgi:hypothetical protein
MAFDPVSSWIGRTLLAGAMIVGNAVAAEAADYNPHIGWQTRQPSLICESYFRVTDGEKAALSGDKKWLAETGCIIAAGGLRLVLLDTPNYKVSHAWRARLYGFGDDSRDVYLRSVDAVGFADAGTYKSEKEALTVLAEMKRRFKRQYERESDLPHRINPTGPEHVERWEDVKLWIGPGEYDALDNFCSAAQDDKETSAEWTARSKRESDEYVRALGKWQPGQPSPKQAGHIGPLKRGHHLNCKVPSKQ